MSAAYNNQLWMVEILLTMGADVYAKDKIGETAMVINENKNARKMMALIELKGRRKTPIATRLQKEVMEQGNSRRNSRV